MSKSREVIKISDYARLSINPLRKLKFDQKVKPNANKTEITLQLGDPSIFGNFPPAKETIEAFKKSVELDKYLYNPGQGRLDAREAVAEYSKHHGPITADDVILTSGCGHALEMCILTLVSAGENLLIPRPSYNYKTWTDGLHIESKQYNLDPKQNWNIDLKHMESLIDVKTRAILINNPGNPCGNVFSREHLLDLIKIADRYNLPIISDEIYEFFTFPGVEFYSLSSLSKNVPVLTCSGLSKRFMTPGIRMGWILINDRENRLSQVRQGLVNVTGRILGPNSAVQHALPEIIKKTPKSFFDQNMIRIHKHAERASEMLSTCPGITPIRPKGAMYMMTLIDLTKFPNISSCREWTEKLIEEQSVLLFPGSPCFNFPGCFRIVLTVPEDKIVEACGRIKEFCEKHYEN